MKQTTRLCLLLAAVSVLVLLWRFGMDRRKVAAEGVQPMPIPSVGLQSDAELARIEDGTIRKLVAPPVNGFVGQVSLASADPDHEVDGQVWLTAASDVALLRGRDGAATLVATRYAEESDSKSGPTLSPLYERLGPFAIERGSWYMPRPDKDLCIFKLSLDGVPAAVESGHLVKQGARTAEVFATTVPDVTLNVAIESGPQGSSFEGLIVREEIAAPDRVGFQVVPATSPDSVGDSSVSSRAATDPSIAIQWNVRPPGSSRRLTASATAPVLIEPTFFYRRIWAGKPGYAWASAPLVPGQRSLSLTLRQSADVELRILNAEAVLGDFEARVEQMGKTNALWIHAPRGAPLKVSGFQVGSARILIHRALGFRKELVCDREVELRPGENRFPIDVGALVAAQPPYGSLEVDLSGPGLDEVKRTRVLSGVQIPLRLVVQPLGAERYDPPVLEVPLSALGTAELGRRAVVPELLPGSYQVLVEPVGIMRVVDVISREVTRESMRIGALATVILRPASTPPGSGFNEPYELHWRQTGSRSSSHSMEGVLGSVREPAFWVGDCWYVRCLAGDIVLQAFDKTGGSILSTPERYEVPVGKSEFTYSSDSGHATFSVDVVGASDFQVAQLVSEIPGALRRTDGVEATFFVHEHQVSNRPQVVRLEVSCSLDGEVELDAGSLSVPITQVGESRPRFSTYASAAYEWIVSR